MVSSLGGDNEGRNVIISMLPEHATEVQFLSVLSTLFQNKFRGIVAEVSLFILNYLCRIFFPNIKKLGYILNIRVQ